MGRFLLNKDPRFPALALSFSADTALSPCASNRDRQGDEGNLSETEVMVTTLVCRSWLAPGQALWLLVRGHPEMVQEATTSSFFLNPSQPFIFNQKDTRLRHPPSGTGMRVG